MEEKIVPSFAESRQNNLLAALERDDFDRIQPYCESVSLSPGQVLYDPGDERTHTYFPTTTIISQVNLIENGSSTQVAVVGNMGLVGCSIIWGGGSAAWQTIVNTKGDAIRIKAADAQAAFKQPGKFQDVLLAYMQVLLTQVSQIATCNRFHTVEQRFCNWLLTNDDQTPGNKLTVTHEFIGSMIGVRRESITLAAGNLQQQGFIELNRGTISLVDRQGIESACCECYQIIKTEYDRVLGKYTRIPSPQTETI